MLIAAASDLVRNDAFRLVVGELIVSAGLVALVLYRFRSHATDRSTLYFGLASLLYGLWLIVELQALHSAFPSIPWPIIDFSINLVIGIPFVLYIGSTIGRAYPWFVRGVVTANVLLAILGTVRLVQQASVDRIQSACWVLAVVSLAGWVYIAVFPKIPIDREVRALRIGLLVLALFALYQHLSAMGGLPRADFLEPIGMVFLLGTFFYVSAARSYRMETNFIAIRNELDIARRIQAALLPKLDRSIAGLEVHARYAPVGSVAGDFYDVLSDGCGLGVLISDVSGHGVPAALSASMLKVALRAQAEQMASPAEVLTGLNRTLSGLLENQFITAAYVYFDTVRRELRYTGAGHPPVLLWRSGARTVEALEENGLFLGPFPEAEYVSISSSFEPGDRCLLYTDGLTEASNRKDEEFGAERLSEFLARNSGLEVNEACSALLDQVTAWLGGGLENQQDDITFVLVEFRPAECLASS
ncbi:MAG: PP2C family protein-serine/threonine phosphatase [Terracidiphilus sp.]